MRAMVLERPQTPLVARELPVPRPGPGQVRIDVGNRVLHPEPGDELQVPAEEPHRIRCGEAGPGRVLQIAFGYQSDDDRLPVEGGPVGDG